METFNQSSGFQYSPNSNAMSDTYGDSEFSGAVEIFVHHARNIHNICIYDNQDVYAKFSLTCNPYETLSTRIINGGGKNPEFNDKLIMKVNQLDAVLKCEMWMLSRARNYMEDQLLGFALVPLSEVVGKGKITHDYSLSSTDLFHSPAGTVKLTLSLNTTFPVRPPRTDNHSISSETVFLDRKKSEVVLNAVEYLRIEFPDINVVNENQQMVSEYFDCLGSKPVSFLHLGASPQPVVHDYEMTMNSSEENQGVSGSPNGSQNSVFLSSTTTSLSDRISPDSREKRGCLCGQSSNSLNLSVTTGANHGSSACPETPTSKKGNEVRDEKKPKFGWSNDEENHKEGNIISVKFGQVFSAPLGLGNINLEAEQSAMQQEIVDMYKRSMQQFTESLGKMKLPMDLGKLESKDPDTIIRPHSSQVDLEKQKRDGSRVFYGSRAFF
ncbi:hypothetical protein K2173_016458 [Erythroxylum novogranatense]|uniref:C2 domain-containing protein n=1 Tax=Erythroxylum novogranatense TaxID=1862640 RepID=A0AAV8SGE7_9ROSI|nr:hypothetical protein K2173_016458 [Erythroxylum novogranatense]